MIHSRRYRRRFATLPCRGTNLLNVNGRESAKRHETLRGLEGLVFFRDFVYEEQREQWEKEAIEVVKKQSMGGKVPKIRIFCTILGKPYYRRTFGLEVEGWD